MLVEEGKFYFIKDEYFKNERVFIKTNRNS